MDSLKAILLGGPHHGEVMTVSSSYDADRISVPINFPPTAYTDGLQAPPGEIFTTVDYQRMGKGKQYALYKEVGIPINEFVAVLWQACVEAYGQKPHGPDHSTPEEVKEKNPYSNPLGAESKNPYTVPEIRRQEPSPPKTTLEKRVEDEIEILVAQGHSPEDLKVISKGDVVSFKDGDASVDIHYRIINTQDNTVLAEIPEQKN